MWTLFRGTSGILLLFLAAAKAINMLYIVVQGDSAHPTMWFVKQSAYAVAFGIWGSQLIRSRPDDA